MDTFSCNRCSIDKPLTDYYKTNTTRGHSTLCKLCMNADSRAWKKANKAAVRIHDATYRENHADDLLISNRVASKKYRETNPEKRQESQKAYHERNITTIRIKNRQHARHYRATHLEQCLENARDWRAEHPEEVKESFKAYRLANIENFQVYIERRRAREKGAAQRDFTPQQWRVMLILCDHRCCYCNRQMQRLTMDHLTPFEKHGNDTLWNILPACKSCNSRKHTGPVLSPVQPFLLLPYAPPVPILEQEKVCDPAGVIPDTQLSLL